MRLANSDYSKATHCTHDGQFRKIKDQNQCHYVFFPHLSKSCTYIMPLHLNPKPNLTFSLLFLTLSSSRGRRQWPFQVNSVYTQLRLNTVWLREAWRHGESREHKRKGKEIDRILNQNAIFRFSFLSWYPHVKWHHAFYLLYFPECNVLGQCVFGSPDLFPNSATHSSTQT